MTYFTKTYFKDDLERPEIEAALRKFASKRHTSLDFKSSSTDVGTEKCFLGLEGKKDLKFTRLRTSFERVLPKLIISFPKNNDQNYYKIRLSFLATIVFGLFSVGVLLNLAFLIAGRTSIDNFLTVLIIFSVNLFLIFLELKLTKSRIKKVLRKYALTRQEVKV